MFPLQFSVVIPLYNKQDQVQRAIRSVLAQTYENFELIVVDDGSTDKSFAVASQIQDPRLIILQQKNFGEGAARNHGVRASKNKYIAFLDADDEWKPGFLEHIACLIETHPNCVLYGTGCERYIDPDHSAWPTQDCFPEGWRGIIGDYLKIIAKRPSPFNSSSTVATKDALERVGGFPEGVVNGSDMATWIRCSLLGDIAYLHQPLSIYYVGLEGSVSSAFDWQNEYYPVKVLQSLLKEKKIPRQSRKYAHYYISKYSLMTAKARFQAGEALQALPLLWNCRYTKSTYRRVINLLFDNLKQSLVKS